MQQRYCVDIKLHSIHIIFVSKMFEAFLCIFNPFATDNTQILMTSLVENISSIFSSNSEALA